MRQEQDIASQDTSNDHKTGQEWIRVICVYKAVSHTRKQRRKQTRRKRKTKGQRQRQKTQARQTAMCYDRAVCGAKATGVHSRDRPGTRVTFD